MGQEAEVFAANGIVIDDVGGGRRPGAPAPLARRRRRACTRCCLASASDVDDLIPTLVAFQIEWNKLRVRQRAAGWPPDERAHAGGVLRRRSAARPTTGRACATPGATRFDERLRLIAERRMNAARAHARRHAGRLRAHDAALVAAGARQLAEQGLGDAPDLLRQLQHPQPGEHRHRHRARARGRAGRVRRDAARGRHPARGAGGASARAAPRARGRTSSTSSRASTSTRTGRRAARRGGAPRQESGVAHLPSRTALRVPAQIIPLAKLHPERLDPRLGEVDAEALAASDAVIVNIDYPLGVAAYNILREVAVSTRGAARRVRARQGGDAQRGRRRRDALERRPRRALGLDLLARQRVRSGRPDGRPALRQRPRQPARGDGQEHLPAEPRLPRLLLPRGLHGGGDGGRALLQRHLRDRRRRPPPRRARRSTSRSSRSTSGSSTTPPTRPTPRPAPWARAGLSYYGMDSTYASSLAILRRVLRLEGALEADGGSRPPGLSADAARPGSDAYSCQAKRQRPIPPRHAGPSVLELRSSPGA